MHSSGTGTWRHMLRPGKMLLALLFILSTGTPLWADEYKYAVRGRAVDIQRRPVPAAYVVILPTPNDRGGDFISTGEADAEGRIRIEVPDSNMTGTMRLLYVTGPLPLDAITPIKPPFTGFRGLTGPAYSAQLVRIKKNDGVDIGNIPVKVFYHTVTVFLKDRSGNPFLKDATAWQTVALRIRDGRGRFIAETSLAPEQIRRAVSPTDSSVRIALPEGVWRIEASPDEHAPWLTSGSAVRVNASSERLRTILRLPGRRLKHKRL